MIKICIPSRGRPECINKDTLNLIPEEYRKNTYVFVNPAEELDEYKKYGLKGVNYIPVPFTGNIAKVRNFILDYFNEGDKVFILDDDIIKIQDSTQKMYDLIPVIEYHFKVIEKLGVKLFAFESTGNPQNCTPYKCFTTFGFCVQASGYIIDNNLRFDDNFKLKEDIEYSCQHFNRFGLTPVFYTFTFRGRSKTNDGGCQTYRTIELEKEYAKLLVEKHPTILKLDHKKDYAEVKKIVKTKRIKY